MRSSFLFLPRLAGLAGCLAVLAGCAAEPKSHSPYIGGGCLAPPCPVENTRAGGPSGGDGGATRSDAGQGTTDLTGVITVFRDPAFLNRAAFAGDGVITVLGTHKIVGAISGQAFTLAHTDFEKNLWADIRATSGGTDLMETISPVDGTATNVELTFGRISDMTSIVGSFTLTPTTMDASLAQIVLRFVNAAGNGVSGVQITQAAGASLLYDAGSLYSDAFDATQARGMAILVNAKPGGALFPGTPLSITFKAGAALGTTDVYAAKGTLTIATVLVK